MSVVVSRLGQDDVEHALEQIAAASEQPDELSIQITGNGIRGIEEVALLGSALLGMPSTFSLDVSDQTVVEAFPRLGLASAVSCSRSVSAVKPEDLHHGRWANTWTPVSSASAAMFQDESDEPRPAGQFGPLHATFNDPHLSVRRTGTSSLTMLIRRWLTQRLQALGEAGSTGFVNRAAFFVDELVRNVHEHAARDDLPPVRSQLHLAWDEVDGRRRVSIAVFDTGPGLRHTLRRTVPAFADVDDEALLEDLLLGKLPEWGRGRGIGLSRCFEIVGQIESARLFLATGDMRCRGEDDSNLKVERKATVPGTVAAVTLPV